MEKENNNETEDGKGLVDKMSDFGKALVFGAAIVGGQMVVAPEAEAQNYNLEQKESFEARFQRLLIRNEVNLNNELSRLGLDTVKLGKSSSHAKCIGYQFGVYTKDGDHIADFLCGTSVFENAYGFIEFAKEKIVPKLLDYKASKLENRNQKSPEELLRIASFDEGSTIYFDKNALTLVIIKTGDKNSACIARIKGRGLPDLKPTLCYNSDSKGVKFSYNDTRDEILVDTIEEDNTNQSATLVPLYNKGGILQGFN